MSRNRRDEPEGRAERSAEQRERDRLAREARRATTEGGPAASEPRQDQQTTPTSPPRDRRPPPPRESRSERATGRRARPRQGDPPAEPPGHDRAAERRAATRRRAPATEREQPPLLRIQPDPPAPPAAAAGALDDETDRPIGIKRMRHAVAPRNSRTVVTPPGDVKAGPARARRSVRSRVTAITVLLILFALIAGILMLFQPFGSAEGKQVRVTIPSGVGAREIGDQLASAGVVSSGFLFSLRATLAGKREDLRSGRYVLNHGMTYGTALDELSKRSVVTKGDTIKITIPEGVSRKELARLIESKGLAGDYLDATKRFSGRLNPFSYGAPKGTRALEGFLFPATYELKPGAPAGDLVAKQLKAFKDNFAKVDLARAKRKNLTGYDVLIIASMVEREAQQAGERSKIAAVIYNRLKDGIPLGIDATIRYATDNWTAPLKQSELQIDSPYNSRKRRGLPPTPIGNPGLASIRAAALPAKVDVRYYVVKPGTCGEHAFSSSFEQFDRDRQRYDQARDAAGGKSPTTC